MCRSLTVEKLVGIVFFATGILALIYIEGKGLALQEMTSTIDEKLITIETREQLADLDSAIVFLRDTLMPSTTHLADTLFKLGVLGALYLRRVAEIYEWVEEERSSTGSSDKSYSYYRSWEEYLINSDDFRHRKRHVNPAFKEFSSKLYMPDSLSIMGIGVDSAFVCELDDYDWLALPSRARVAFVNAKAKVSGAHYYFGDRPDSPAVGDERVRFEYLPRGLVSLIGFYDGIRLHGLKTAAGDWYYPMKRGAVAPEELHGQFNTDILAFRFGRIFLLVFTLVGAGLLASQIGKREDLKPFIRSYLHPRPVRHGLLFGLGVYLLILSVMWFGNDMLHAVLIGLPGVAVLLTPLFLPQSRDGTSSS
ncbi:MAG: hypothetical protein GF331_06795 [Chitinivibrionales bacterium]|nr:hypothetical protein [Chitinivibrionales bacterium]